MQFATLSHGTHARVGNDMIRILTTMMRDEPVVRQGIRMVQSHCLSGGISLRFGEAGTEPTPSFQRHVEFYYTEFCREAIEAFMAVGFVPYRLREAPNGATVPEVMPIGSYAWSVTPTATGRRRPTQWVATVDGRLPSSSTTTTTTTTTTTQQQQQGGGGGKRPKLHGGALLSYDVTTTYCDEPIYVYAFVPPHPMYACNSSMASVMPTYNSLCNKRECVARADSFNCQPGMVLEQQDALRINDVASNGQTISQPVDEVIGRLNGDKNAIGGRQRVHYELFNELRSYSHLPEESVAVVAPINHTLRNLERVTTPMDLAIAELAFSRRVASALGLPETMLLQGAHAVGARSSAMGGTPGWAECAENSNRQILDLCRHVNMHLQRLMSDVYERIYGVIPRHEPVFRMVTVPTFGLEQLLEVWKARLIDDGAFSAMLEATWGAPLGGEAVTAREEERKAEFELPFRDRVMTPASANKKRR
jgi:hypothetical protein